MQKERRTSVNDQSHHPQWQPSPSRRRAIKDLFPFPISLAEPLRDPPSPIPLGCPPIYASATCALLFDDFPTLAPKLLQHQHGGQRELRLAHGRRQSRAPNHTSRQQQLSSDHLQRLERMAGASHAPRVRRSL
jgi:hypothetical protein